MRADRLLALLLLLQTRGRTTARDLAVRLEVSERTIYRDLDALSAAGMPVYAERGPGGGCSLPPGYRTTLTGLTVSETRTLGAAGTAGPLADLGLGKAQAGLLLKVLAALPEAQRPAAERARQRLHLDASPWFRPRESLPYLNVVQEAVWEGRRLRLAYHRRDGSLFQGLVEPYGLVAKTSLWYVIAAAGDDTRAYRLARIAAAEVVDETFERDPAFDLAAFWTEWCSTFEASRPRYPVVARIAPAGLAVLSMVLGEGMRAAIDTAGPPDAEGWRELPLVFESMEAARTRLLGLGPVAEVLDPPELRESIRLAATAIAALHEASDGGA
jgi:predicted DNA-binding transcriptional regulator YafY